jgi:HSP20 family protein
MHALESEPLGLEKAEGKGRQKAEGRRQKAEGRRQKAEGRRQGKAEGRRQKAEGRNLEVEEDTAMTLTRWSPVNELAALEIDRLNRMFESAFSGEPLVRGGWVPAVDIYENANKDIVVKIDLPDMKREDIKVTFENTVLSIEGERPVPAELSREQAHRLERGYGAFRRSFTMPVTVDASRVEAVYQEGVLTITLARREEARPKQIRVHG